jgi:hypothetical protein
MRLIIKITIILGILELNIYIVFFSASNRGGGSIIVASTSSKNRLGKARSAPGTGRGVVAVLDFIKGVSN